MRLSSLSTLVAAVALAASAAPVSASADAGPLPDHPQNPVVTGQGSAAEQALAAVQAAFAGENGARARAAGPGSPGRDLTMQLLQLRLGFDDLSPAEQQVARPYLARPTDGDEYYGANYGKGARPTNDCKPRFATPSSNVCVHWARKTTDRPPMKDSDGDGIPNQVEKTRDTMNLVWSREVDSGGYKAPLPDTKGPDSKLDVYLVNIGDKGLYGYCGSENVGQSRAAAAYCVLDNNYSHREFPAHTPLENLQVTAAHEFFHAVQFAYDVREDPWLMESTATWMEDEIFDDVNDNRGYLPYSIMRHPEKPLDSSYPYYYGDWIWWRYLTEKFPQEQGTGLPVFVRDVWEYADNSGYSGTYSMKALEQALTDRSTDLSQVLAEFGADNRNPAAVYEEGDAYKKAKPSAAYTLTADKHKVREQTIKLPHLSNTTAVFKPDASYSNGAWLLQLDVDLPGSVHEPHAQATVFLTDGTTQRQAFTLGADGTGSLQVPFSSATVKRVELTLTDGDHTYDCKQATSWSCHGTPDKQRPFSYSASAVQ